MDFEGFLQLIGIGGGGLSEAERHRIDYEVALSDVRRTLQRAQRLPGTDNAAKAVQQRMEQAAREAAQGHHAAALKLLEPCPGLLRVALEKGNQELESKTQREEELQKGQRTQTRAKEPYLADLVRAREALLALQDLPGAEAHWRELSQTIQSAEGLAEAGKYKEATSALSGVAGKLEAGKKAHVERLSQASKLSKEAVRLQVVLGQRLDADPALAPAAASELRNQLAAVVAPLYVQGATAQTGQQVAEALRVLEGTIDVACQRAAVARQQAESALKMCRDALGRLPRTVTPADRADLDHRLLRMQGWLEQREHGNVLEALPVFLDDTEAMQGRVAQSQQQWLTDSAGLDGLASDCRGWVDGGGPLMARAEPTPAQVLERIERLRKAEVGVHLGFTQAMQILHGITADHLALKGRAEAQQSLLKAIEDGDREVQEAARVAREAQQRLCDEANRWLQRKEQPTIRNAGEYGQQIEACLGRWKAAQASATTPEGLPVAALQNELRQIAQVMDGKRGDSAYMRLSGQEQTEAALGSYRESRGRCIDVLEQVEQWGSPRLVLLRQELERIDRLLQPPNLVQAQGVQRLTAELQELTRSARVALDEARDLSANLQRECRELVEGVDKRLGELKQKIDDFKQSFLTNNPQYAEYHKSLAQQFAELRGMQLERDPDVLSDAKRELVALKLRVQQAFAAVQGSNLPSDAPTLEGVTGKIKVARAALKNELLSTYLGVTLSALKTRLEDIEGAATARPMDESIALLAAWQQSLDEALGRAGHARAYVKAFEGECKLVGERLKQHEREFAAQGDYLADLRERLQKCRTAGRPEGRLEDARSTLQALSDEIDRALAEPQAMKDGQSNVLAQAARKELDQAAWQGLYEAFRSRTLPEAKKVASAELMKELRELGEAAEQTFKKTGDLELAEQQLRVAMNRAQDVIAYPEGKAQHFRKQLPQAEQSWKAAVQAFGDQLEALKNSVTDTDPGAAQPMAEASQQLKDVFQAGAFAVAVAAMNAPGASAAERRSARESGLATVRSYRGELVGNRRIVALGRNPFVTPFNSLMKLNNALFELERNLLIGA